MVSVRLPTWASSWSSASGVVEFVNALATHYLWSAFFEPPMDSHERIKAIYSTPSKRGDADYMRDIPSDIVRGVLMLLREEHKRIGDDDWLAETCRALLHLHEDFETTWENHRDCPLDGIELYFSSSPFNTVAFLDFLELLFKLEQLTRCEFDLAKSISFMFDNPTCPYRLSTYLFQHMYVRKRRMTPFVAEWPTIRIAHDPATEAHAIVPAMKLLADHEFAAPNRLFVKALKRQRARDYEGAIASSVSAAESALKVIAGKKGWKVTGSGIGSVMQSFQRESGIRRQFGKLGDVMAEFRENKSDVHGKEIVVEATEAEAQFMIGLCASFIVYVASEAPVP